MGDAIYLEVHRDVYRRTGARERRGARWLQPEACRNGSIGQLPMRLQPRTVSRVASRPLLQPTEQRTKPRVFPHVAEVFHHCQDLSAETLGLIASDRGRTLAQPSGARRCHMTVIDFLRSPLGRVARVTVGFALIAYGSISRPSWDSC